MRALALRFLLCFLLAGCAMSESDCRGTDWYQRGERDGYGGHPPQDLRLAQQCARYGVTVPREYQDGWAAGHDEHDRLRTMMDP
jgi:hypothetical protein